MVTTSPGFRDNGIGKWADFWTAFFVTLDITHAHSLQKPVRTHPAKTEAALADGNPAGVLNRGVSVYIVFRKAKTGISILCMEGLRLTRTVKSTKRDAYTASDGIPKWTNQSARIIISETRRVSQLTSLPSRPMKDLVYATRHVRVHLQ